jgi:hypothetical protein
MGIGCVPCCWQHHIIHLPPTKNTATHNIMYILSQFYMCVMCIPNAVQIDTAHTHRHTLPLTHNTHAIVIINGFQIKPIQTQNVYYSLFLFSTATVRNMININNK